jgi:hypothetical protein
VKREIIHVLKLYNLTLAMPTARMKVKMERVTSNFFFFDSEDLKALKATQLRAPSTNLFSFALIPQMSEQKKKRLTTKRKWIVFSICAVFSIVLCIVAIMINREAQKDERRHESSSTDVVKVERTTHVGFETSRNLTFNKAPFPKANELRLAFVATTFKKRFTEMKVHIEVLILRSCWIV